MRLEDLTGKKTDVKIEDKVIVDPTDFEPITPENPDEEYLLIDPQIVGYPDLEMQEQIYSWAAEVLPIVGTVEVVDIGAGRGDFSTFLAKNRPGLNVIYDGFESNGILVQAGQRNGVINLFQKTFASVPGQELSEWKGWSFCIGSMNVNYGWEDKWEYFDRILRHSLQWVSDGIVFILNHSTEEEGYEEFPIPEMVNYLSQNYPNIPFNIDYSKFDGIYRLVIYNKKFSE